MSLAAELSDRGSLVTWRVQHLLHTGAILYQDEDYTTTLKQL